MKMVRALQAAANETPQRRQNAVFEAAAHDPHRPLKQNEIGGSALDAYGVFWPVEGSSFLDTLKGKVVTEKSAI